MSEYREIYYDGPGSIGKPRNPDTGAWIVDSNLPFEIVVGSSVNDDPIELPEHVMDYDGVSPEE